MDEVATLNKWIRTLGLFYGIELLTCVVVNYSTFFGGFRWRLFTEMSLGLFALLFVANLWKELRTLFGFSSFSFLKAAVYSGASVLIAIVVNFVVRWVNHAVFHNDVSIYHSFRHLDHPILGMIVLVIVLPAVFEEIAYRGLILESLLQLTDARRAIMISAILFALIHMNFVAVFWLVPFAIWLGNVRYREGTIWYGVLIHLFFNLTACLFEFVF